MENISVSFTVSASPFCKTASIWFGWTTKYFGIDLSDLLQIDSQLATGKAESPVVRDWNPTQTSVASVPCLASVTGVVTFSGFKTVLKSLWSDFVWILYVTHNLWEEVNLDFYSVNLRYLGSLPLYVFSQEISSSSERRKVGISPNSHSSGGFNPSDHWGKQAIHSLLLTHLFLAGFLTQFWWSPQRLQLPF